MSRATRRWAALALGVVSLGIVALVTRRLGDGTYAVSGDAHYLYLTARSIAFDGDLDLSNQLRAMGDRWGLGRDPAADGWRFPPREIGPALLMVPGLVVHHWLGLPETWAPTFAVILPSLSLPLLFLACGAILNASSRPRREALAMAMTLGFVVPYYTVGRAGYAHAPDAVIGALLVVALIRRERAAAIGALLAIAVLFRLQNFLWLAWPGVELIRDRSFDRARRLALIFAVSLVGLAPQVWLAVMHPGSEHGPIRWGLDFFDFDQYVVDLIHVLIGGHGLLSWTPIAAVALYGLVAGSRGELRRLAVPAVAVLVLNVLLVAAVRDPSGGWAFGARRLAGCTGLLCLGLGLSATFRPFSTRAKMFGWLTLGIVALNLILTALALAGWISLAPTR